MDAQDQLEKFRTQWINELKSETRSSNHVFQGQQQSPGSSSQGSNASAASSGRIVPELPDPDNSGFQNPHEARKFGSDDITSNNYSPFKIVGKLLAEKDHSKLDERLDRSKFFSFKQDLTFVAGDGSSGEKLKTRNKRLKLSKLEDIFVERQYGEIPKERLLDVLISDIDEITEIPFFDISLPSEVAIKIFQYLGIKDLCSCAQVSKSWCHLAEDELLWCRICHRLGNEKIFTTCEKHNWKQIVRHNVERQRLMVSNWKNRVGKLSSLEHPKGKILCSVHVCEDTVVAWYTSGDVKLWNLASGDSCVFQPSSTSLILDEYGIGLQQNIVSTVITAGVVTVAAYTQGNVDIWNLASGSRPLQTFTPTTGNQYTPSVYLSSWGTTLAVSYSTLIDILYRKNGEEEFSMVQHFDTQSQVKHLRLYDTDCDISTVIFSKDCSVHLYQPHTKSDKQFDEEMSHVTEIHNLIGSSVDVIDFKTDQSVLGVAHTGSFWFGGLTDGFKVNLYDLKTCKQLQTLNGHTLNVSCMNLLGSPPHELVTGSGDRKVRVYDMRTREPQQTLIGHSSYVTCVQMDDWKVVSGAENGFLYVWDRRMATKLWEFHNRHPVRYSHFNDKTLVVANIASNKFPHFDDFEDTTHRRYRGTLSVYNFLEDLTTKDVPEICLSTYDQPDASRYNIALAVPYDTLNY